MAIYRKVGVGEALDDGKLWNSPEAIYISATAVIFQTSAATFTRYAGVGLSYDNATEAVTGTVTAIYNHDYDWLAYEAGVYRPGKVIDHISGIFMPFEVAYQSRTMAAFFGGDDVFTSSSPEDYYQRRDTIFAGAGNDVIRSGDGADTLYGEDGEDEIWAGGDDDFVYGGNDRDTIRGGDGFDNLEGNGGDDAIFGGADYDLLFGGEGNDVLRGQDGGDGLYGGYGGKTGVLTGDDQLFGGAGDDELFGQDGNDHLSGGADNDLLSDGEGDDIMQGGAGNDRFALCEGNDRVMGGDGHDVMVFAGHLDELDITVLSNGRSLVSSSNGNDTLSSVEEIAALDGFLRWSEATNTWVAARYDYFAASQFNALYGDQDTYFVYRSAEVLFETRAKPGDTVLRGNDYGDVLIATGSTDVRLYGEGGNDVLVDSAGENILVGGDGLDTAVFNKAFSDLAITQTQNGFWVISYGEVDSIAQVERIETTDGLREWSSAQGEWFLV